MFESRHKIVAVPDSHTQIFHDMEDTIAVGEPLPTQTTVPRKRPASQSGPDNAKKLDGHAQILHEMEDTITVHEPLPTQTTVPMKRPASPSEHDNAEQLDKHDDTPLISDIIEEPPPKGKKKTANRGRPRKARGGRVAKKPPTRKVDDDKDMDDGRDFAAEVNIVEKPVKKRVARPKKEPTTPNVEIPVEEPRRSGRSRAAPKDPYTETLAMEESKPKRSKTKAATGGGGRGRGRKKKMTLEEMFEPKNLTSRDSPWCNKIDLAAVFSKDFMENRITEEQRELIISWLPECDLVYPNVDEDDPDAISKPDPKPQINHNIWQNPIFKDALANWTNDLSMGKYEQEYIERGKKAREQRMAGKFDAWKEKNFEEFWGQKQRLYHDATAGESSKVKVEHLVKYHAFKIGDVFSVRRSFAGGIHIRKDAVLTATDPKNYSMTFAYPSGNHEWEKENVKNKTISKVNSLTALENLLIRENGSFLGDRIPNGNAFKTVRIIRKGEDIGCVFDVRAKFWHQYLEDPEDKDLENI